MEVLDKNGLEHFWDKAKEYVDSNKTTSYSPLTDKPKINNVELNGNKSLGELGIQLLSYGSEEPTNESYTAWLDPNGETINIPTKTSDLTNDSDFITNNVDNLTNYTKTSELSIVATSGSYNDLSNKPTIPTKVSQLTNDSNYATENWVEDKISNIQPSGGGGSSSYETVEDYTINNGTTQNINFSFNNSYNELIVYIDLGGNNKKLGSVFWKINNINANYTNFQTYRYYCVKYTVTPIFTVFDASNTNNNNVGYNVVRGISYNTNKISNFSITLSGSIYFPNGTSIKIVGR